MLDRVHEERERHQLEARLRQAEKAESLGRMAGAVAHHFNNMLGVIEGGIDMALQELPPEQGVREDLARALVAARRAADMSGLMLAYLGQNAGRQDRLDLSRTVQESLHSLQTAMPANVRLTAHRPSPGPIVSADAAQLGRMLQSLITNGWEAIGANAGEVRVTVRTVNATEIPASRVAGPGWQPTAAGYASIEITDTGCGMSPAMLEKIFDPFFTTKHGSRGLGLAVVLGTVRAHNGAVTVQSSEGGGTKVQVFLPAMAAVDEPGRTGSSPAAGPTATGGLVLVADDEEIVRQMVRRILVKMGFEVVTAADGVEAVDRFRQHMDAVRLVLLDLTMPMLDGWGALTAIRALRSEVPIILASGYDGSQVMADAHADLPQEFLHKPYLIDDLRGAIQRALSGK